jgi:cysteine desulfurase
MKLPIYMDNHATTPVDPRVFEAMRPYFHRHVRQLRQPESQLRLGGEDAVEKARKQIADLIGATAKEIVFHQRRDGIEQPGAEGRR